MKLRTAILLLIALVAGVVAAVATHDLVDRAPHSPEAQPRSQTDSDPGLAP